MKTEVRIAEFKSRFSKYLRAAQGGQEIVVKDRETPIARVVPYRPSPQRLESRMPTRSLKDIDKLFEEFHARHPRRVNLKPADVDEALREERRERLGS